ncbi:MAG: hypothetical protein EON59_08545 [Alphaproteobacteria bacterium]|nr:MAG: hypothetical protein EON59_08545 [Alphaproteobacteria bacterium]
MSLTSTSLKTLPADFGAHGEALRTLVSAAVAQPDDADLSAFLFLPDQNNHPHFDDAAQVFAEAAEQMYLRKPWVGDEIPLLFFGYHAMNRLTGKRTAQGLFLTDQAIYLQDEMAGLLLGLPPAKGHSLPAQSRDTEAFVQLLLTQYREWKDWSVLANTTEPALMSHCGRLLNQIVRSVVEYNLLHHRPRQPSIKALTLADLVSGHSASDTLLNPANPALTKKLAKVAAKLKVPPHEPLLFALVDFPLFGGPYGLGVTAHGLYSKDLMDDPQHVALTALDPDDLRLSEKGDKLLNSANVTLVLPAHLEVELRTAFLAFLKQEIVRLKTT